MPTCDGLEETDGGYPSDLVQVLRVLIAYENILSGQLAIRLLHNLQRAVGKDFQFQPLPWSFALLSDPAWVETTLADASGADMIWISLATPAPLPPAVERWVKAAVDQKHGTTSAVVALVGPLGTSECNNAAGLQSVRQAAESAGVDFFVPADHESLHGTIESILKRADTITPLLGAMLDYHSDFLLPHNAQTS